jgi:hypothetical protein
LIDLIEKGFKYFSGKPDYKDAVKKILTNLSKNDDSVEKISKIINLDKGIDNNSADKILKLPYVQTQIIKMVDSTNGKLEETELTNQLKTIFLKSWNDKSIMDNVVYKAKKDIK